MDSQIADWISANAVAAWLIGAGVLYLFIGLGLATVIINDSEHADPGFWLFVVATVVPLWPTVFTYAIWRMLIGARK